MNLQEKKFVITSEMFDKCTEFAKNSVISSADKYIRRQQFSIAKMCDDIRNGKIGEEGAWQIISKILPNLSKPDYSIYEVKNKSWDVDLKDPDSGTKIAIKSQDIKSELLFSKSWVFQFGDGEKDCDKEIFFPSKEDNKYVCFVSLNVPKRIGELQAIVKVPFLHTKKLFKPMVKSSLSSKLAVYYEDLEKHKDLLWQL